MGLFSSSKKITNVEETFNKALNAAAEDDGFAFAVESGGTVNVEAPKVAQSALDFANNATSEVLASTRDIVNSSNAAVNATRSLAANALNSSNSQVAAALGALSENAKSTEERGLDSIVTIFAIIAAGAAVVMVAPKLFKG